MLHRIKTALLGDEPRTDGGWTAPRSETADAGGPRGAPDVADVDPFRPASHLADDGTCDQVGMDQIFGILGNQRRRYVLTYLSTTEGPVTLNDLAEQIAAWECGKGIAQLTSQERKRVYVGLYQCHLPKMADADAISYDKQRGTVETGEQFELFSYYLRRDE